MLRLRLLRVLLPAILVLFVVLVVVAFRQRPDVHGQVAVVDAENVRQVEGFRVIEMQGETRTLEFKAGLAQQRADGRYHLEDIEEFVVHRQGRPPLVVSSEVGEIGGAAGGRKMRFDDRVVIRDPVNELVLELPTLEVDEAAAEARSEGRVRFEAPGWTGDAAGLRYRLDGRPTELLAPVLVDEGGARLEARRALLLDGLDDVLLDGGASLRREGERIDAGRIETWRREGRLSRARFEEGVRGTSASAAGLPLALEAAAADLELDAAGRVRRVRLERDAVLRRGETTVAASEIEARREENARHAWWVGAQGAVHVTARFAGGPVDVRTEELVALLDEERRLRQATALHAVTVEAPGSRAEAERAEFRAPDEIRLYGSAARKARMAQDRSRVAAERIVTDPRGERLVAEGHVDASLLGADRGAESAVDGLFAAGEAVHFLAAALESRDAGARLAFSGGVRAWQGERNLSAERVDIDQRTRTLRAREEVFSRLPREAGRPAVEEADFVLVTADALDYDEAAARAVYEGRTQVRLAEGWLEADRLEIGIGPAGRRVEEIRAFGAVRVEFRHGDEATGGRVAGRADRLVYRPEVSTVWLHGDSAPASVRRIVPDGGTTSGRVLRYRLDLGHLEVESGDGGPARIRTSG